MPEDLQDQMPMPKEHAGTLLSPAELEALKGLTQELTTKVAEAEKVARSSASIGAVIIGEAPPDGGNPPDGVTRPGSDVTPLINPVYTPPELIRGFRIERRVIGLVFEIEAADGTQRAFRIPDGALARKLARALYDFAGSVVEKPSKITKRRR